LEGGAARWAALKPAAKSGTRWKWIWMAAEVAAFPQKAVA